MHFVAPILAPLVYEADQSTQVRLRDYVVNHVFEDLDEDQPEDDDGKVVFCLLIMFTFTVSVAIVHVLSRVSDSYF